VTLINKGIYTEEKRCYIYSYNINLGNGIVICNEKDFANNTYNMNEEIVLTKLSNYISFFKNKNLAMIKMDIEGLEGKAIQSGIELYILEYLF